MFCIFNLKTANEYAREYTYTRAAGAKIKYSSTRREEMSLLPEMLVPVLVLVVASTPRPSPTEAWHGHGDEPFRLRRPLAGRPDSARTSPHARAHR